MNREREVIVKLWCDKAACGIAELSAKVAVRGPCMTVHPINKSATEWLVVIWSGERSLVDYSPANCIIGGQHLIGYRLDSAAAIAIRLLLETRE